MVTLDFVSDLLSRTEKSRLTSAAHLSRRYLTWSSRFENLEPRTLLSSTLYVTDPSVAVDATHYHTLQSALMVAGDGDTIMLQPGFSSGTFVKTTLSSPATAGSTIIHTTAALDVGDVITIGSFTPGDPAERDLVTGVTIGSGDFLISLAAPLTSNHTGSPVDATNSSSTGPAIGLNKSITLMASSSFALPFGLELWPSSNGVTVSNVQVPVLNVISDHNTLNNVTSTGQTDVFNAHNNTFNGLTITGQFGQLLMDTGSSFNTVANSSLSKVRIAAGAHDNTFTGSTFATFTMAAVANSNGGDLFQGNTFTKAIKILGNTSVATNDSFINNTFTVTTGDALTLEHANGTVVLGNTFTDSANFANDLVVHNSSNVIASGNHFTTTGSEGTGIYAYADGTGTTSVDISGNVAQTGDGWGIYLGKYSSTANLDVRVQFNDLRNNAIGVFVDGDGNSAGIVDLGELPGASGASTFGVSAGMNDFSSYTSADDSHFAIGLFDTSAGFTVHADNDVWTVANPLNVVADSTHTTVAAGTGVIQATPFVPAPTEVLTATGASLSVVQTGTTSGVVASFSSNLTRVASDFTVSIDWGDGTSSQGIVVANTSGGFDVMASHAWSTSGNAAFTVSVLSKSTSVTTSAQGSVAVTPRTMTLTPQSFNIVKGSTFTGSVATFTDNLAGTTASSYVASITWSDGVTSSATITKNADGSFSVNTSRGFSQMGVVIASVSVGTVDGLFSGVASLTATVTNKNDKVPPGKDKKLNQVTIFIQSVITDTHKKDDKHDCSRLKKSHCCK